MFTIGSPISSLFKESVNLGSRSVTPEDFGSNLLTEDDICGAVPLDLQGVLRMAAFRLELLQPDVQDLVTDAS